MDKVFFVFKATVIKAVLHTKAQDETCGPME